MLCDDDGAILWRKLRIYTCVYLGNNIIDYEFECKYRQFQNDD